MFDADALAQTYWMKVWSYLRALGCEPSLADDLTQDTFLAVLAREFVDFQPGAIGAYLRTTALHMLVSHQRRFRRVHLLAILEHGELNALGHCDDSTTHLHDGLSRLPDRARTALQMRFWGNHTRKEIAAALGITEHGAKNLMQRAKRKLREHVSCKLAQE